MASVRPRQGRDDLDGFCLRRFHLRVFTVLPFGQQKKDDTPGVASILTPITLNVEFEKRALSATPLDG